MKLRSILKSVVFYFILTLSVVVSAQKLKFKIENNSSNKNIFLTSIDDEVLKKIYDKEDNFEIDFLNFDEGYYLLKKEDKTIVLYLKPTDELKINFDNDNFYNSLNFSGEGAYINSYLNNKRTEFLDKNGSLKKYYKKEFYEGDENAYLSKLDRIYKENYGALFGGHFDKGFIEEEKQNLKYAYATDLLKYQDAKKHYKYKDSLAPSKYFLEPLNHIHYQNNQYFQKFDSYKELAILKWKKDIENAVGLPLKQDVFSSIRIEALQQGVLRSLYEDMNNGFPERTKEYYQLIKRNITDNKFLLKTKEKYAILRHVGAEKNLSKFKFKNSDGELEKLSQFKGKYILLNIWTTDCKECLKEFRKIEKLEDKFYEENIVFVSVSVDEPETYELWVSMLEKHGIKGNQLFLDDSKSKLMKNYEIKKTPSFVIISPKGVPLDYEIMRVSSKQTEKIIANLFKE